MYGGGVRNLGVHFFEFWGPILAFWVLPILGVFGPPGPRAHFGGFLPFLGVLVILSVFGVFECCECMPVFVGVERVMNDVGE